MARSALFKLTPTRPTVGLSLSLAPLRKAWPKVVVAFESAWVAFPLLFLLQLKMIWGIWAAQDIPPGDTAYYFTEAWQWFTQQTVNVGWSPLYTVFYGSFLFVNPDPVWATVAHRVVIVLTASMLVLAVLRQLLPANIAWMCAAWWSILPIIFNTLYEVHLFSAIPVLTVWLLMLTATGPWRRAAALGLLAASAVLLRNELSVPTLVMGCILAWYELRRLRRGEGTTIRSTLLAYATALTVAVGLCAMTYNASRVQYPLLSAVMTDKHTVNMAQVYAFGYQQRHAEWTPNPWLECYSLMQTTFGKPKPTLSEMIEANPGAVAEHFRWNVSLTPNGLQLLLFNRVTGTAIPDYDPSLGKCMNSPWGARLAVAMLTLWAVGFGMLWRGRREWWRDWLSPRAIGWAAMFAVASVVPLIILTQRPRPCYLFTFAVLLMAITGMCLHAVTTRWQLVERLRSVAPLFMVGVLLLVPQHFAQSNTAARWTANAVDRLYPYRDDIRAYGTVTVLTDKHGQGLYIHPRCHRAPDQILAFNELIAKLRPDESFAALLERHKVRYIYVEEKTIGWLNEGKCPDAAEFVEGRVSGWELLAAGNTPNDRWRIYRRVK